MADGTEVRHKAQHNRYGTWPCVFRHRNPNPCPLLAAAVADDTPDVQGPAKLPGNPDGIDLDAMKARADAATEGPWYVDGGRDGLRLYWQIGDILRDMYGRNSVTSDDEATIRFIAAARSDVPALVAEVERLRVENEELNRADELMVAQFRTMQREKEHGWDEADRREAERDAALARIRAVEVWLAWADPEPERNGNIFAKLRAALAAPAGESTGREGEQG